MTRAPLPPPPSTPEVVVGVGPGSEADAVVAWATREAELRGADLVLVDVDHWCGEPDTGLVDRDLRRARLADLADRAWARLPGRVRTESLEGLPARALVARAADAALLVLGADHALGEPVAALCVRRATCPVVVLPSALVVV